MTALCLLARRARGGARSGSRLGCVGQERQPAGRADRHDRGAQADGAHAHDRGQRFDLSLAGSHHRAGGRRLSRRRGLRRRGRSRREGPGARRLVRRAAGGRGRIESKPCSSSARRSSQRAGVTEARPLAGRHGSAVSPSDLDQLRSEAKAAEAQLESAKADLETAKLRLKFTHVTAPDDGMITSRGVTVGQVAQAGGEMLRLLRQGRVEWRGEIPEARLEELEPGQPSPSRRPTARSTSGTIRVVAPTVTDRAARASSTSICRPIRGCDPACSRAATS